MRYGLFATQCSLHSVFSHGSKTYMRIALSVVAVELLASLVVLDVIILFLRQVLGCVPVIVQDDGKHPRVAQAFEPHLNWSEFSVLVKRDEIQRLPELLRETDLKSKQAALTRVWTRMVWRGALSDDLAPRMPSPDAFETTMASLMQQIV